MTILILLLPFIAMAQQQVYQFDYPELLEGRLLRLQLTQDKGNKKFYDAKIFLSDEHNAKQFSVLDSFLYWSIYVDENGLLKNNNRIEGDVFKAIDINLDGYKDLLIYNGSMWDYKLMFDVYIYDKETSKIIKDSPWCNLMQTPVYELDEVGRTIRVEGTDYESGQAATFFYNILPEGAPSLSKKVCYRDYNGEIDLISEYSGDTIFERHIQDMDFWGVEDFSTRITGSYFWIEHSSTAITNKETEDRKYIREEEWRGAYRREGVKVYTSLEEALQQPKDVYILDLINKGLTELPPEIEKLKNLKELYLRDNKIKLIPDFIAGLNLKVLDLHGNQITEWPEVINEFYALEALDMGFNKLTEIPHIHFTLLKKLVLRGNQIHTLDNQICRLPSLEILNLYGNELRTLPEEATNMVQLHYLELDGNKFDDSYLLFLKEQLSRTAFEYSMNDMFIRRVGPMPKSRAPESNTSTALFHQNVLDLRSCEVSPYNSQVKGYEPTLIAARINWKRVFIQMDSSPVKAVLLQSNEPLFSLAAHLAKLI